MLLESQANVKAALYTPSAVKSKNKIFISSQICTDYIF